MASKMYFVRGKEKSFVQRQATYQFYPGFAASQRKKNVISFHEAIQKKYGSKEKRILEVSSKSDLELGKKLSAFNLRYKGTPVECWFQSSKCFNGNDKGDDSLIYTDPLTAKRAVKGNGEVTSFLFEGHRFPLVPRSLCYDYIYCLALYNAKDIDKDELAKFNVFTDIEFNQDKQFNCQARSVCIFTYLYKHGLLKEALNSPEDFLRLVY